MFSLLVFMVFNETLPGLDELNVSSYWKGGIPLGLGKVRWENHPTKWILARMVPLKSLPMFTGWWFGTFLLFIFYFSEGLKPPTSLPMVCVLAMRICTKQLGANAEYLRLSMISSHRAGRFIQVTPHVMNLYVCHGNLQTLLGWWFLSRVWSKLK